MTRKEGKEGKKWRCEDKLRLEAKFAQIQFAVAFFFKARTGFDFIFSLSHTGGQFHL